MEGLAKQYGFKFPYLFDEDQSVALSYQAACTPDFFLLIPPSPFFTGDSLMTHDQETILLWMALTLFME